MSQFCKLHAHGRLTSDPLRQVDHGGRTTTRFGLAINEYYRTPAGELREETTFINCSAYGRTAEIVINHLKKGYLTIIEGRLKARSWLDEQTQKKRTVHEITVTYVHFLPQSVQPQQSSPEQLRDTDRQTSEQEGVVEEVILVDGEEVPTDLTESNAGLGQPAATAAAGQPQPGANPPQPTAT